LLYSSVLEGRGQASSQEGDLLEVAAISCSNFPPARPPTQLLNCLGEKQKQKQKQKLLQLKRLKAFGKILKHN
jgi:hypothetical protein